MTFDDYQQEALKTALAFPSPQTAQMVWVLGLAGESGELADKWKKIIAYHDGSIEEGRRQELGKELGDVLWYIAVFADSLGLSLTSIAKDNLAKTRDRQARGVIKGRGDNR